MLIGAEERGLGSLEQAHGGLGADDSGGYFLRALPEAAGGGTQAASRDSPK